MNEIKQAITHLTMLRRLDSGEKKYIYDTAISALQTQQADAWIPVSERLPEDRLDVDVTIKEKSNEVGGYRYYTAVAWMQDGRWVFKRSQYNPAIIAWKYRATPYKEDTHAERN